MLRLHRTAVLVAITLIAASGPQVHTQQAPAPVKVTAADLTPEQMEQFLLTARVIAKRTASRGVTDAVRATFSDGKIVHDAFARGLLGFNQNGLLFGGRRMGRHCPSGAGV